MDVLTLVAGRRTEGGGDEFAGAKDGTPPEAAAETRRAAGAWPAERDGRLVPPAVLGPASVRPEAAA
ncbi:hypothetical protein [Nonomuraea sp. NPDC049309]|uniref:hypothetical protein n=1 Tax=Nonomuraea sp. NPDC049309 TaxID=3364350 RepID=UPI003721D2E9